jgi:hypothetical protein
VYYDNVLCHSKKGKTAGTETELASDEVLGTSIKKVREASRSCTIIWSISTTRTLDQQLR